MAREIKGEITSITEKYIYTTEIIHTPRIGYQLVYIPGYSWCCTVYPTEEAAWEAAEYTLSSYGTKARCLQTVHLTDTRIVYHRYRNKGQ